MNLKSKPIALILSLILIASISLIFLAKNASGAEDPRDPGKVNNLLEIIKTPGTPTEIMKPGDKGEFKFKVSNPYEGNMTNILVNASIYVYATIEVIEEVTSSWETPYVEESNSIEYSPPLFNLSSGEERNISFTIVTDYDTPHGGVFSQSTYFLRFWLEFDYTNVTGSAHLVMKSPGYFPNDVWLEAQREPTDADEPYYRGKINITYLQVMTGQVDGIIPDSSFALKDPIPMWPFYALIVLMVVSAVLALLFYIEENPGTWPWMERKWLGLKGKLHQTFRISRTKKK